LMLIEKNQCVKAGSSVSTMIIAATIAKVLVKASGLKSLPSAATMVKIGRKLTMVVVMAVTMAWDTSDDALKTTSSSDSPGPERSICCSIFSQSTMPISTITPMAIAIPVSETMLASTEASFIAMNVISTATGSIPEMSNDVRRFSTITTITMIVIIISSV